MRFVRVTVMMFLSCFVSATAASASPVGGFSAPEETLPATTVSGARARLLPSGQASVPAGAPQAVQQMIRAGNRIVGRPYVYGGGHGSFRSRGYDCSGTVSYALHGGGVLSSPLASGPLMTWGRSGRGRWVTVYTNSGHAYMQIAGLRLDTSAAGDPRGGKGPRWRPRLRSHRGFVARHPAGL